MGYNYDAPYVRPAHVQLWGDPADKTERIMVVKRKRGRAAGFLKETSLPLTPFQALRYRLKLTTKQWSDLLGVSASTINASDRGVAIPEVQLAKRMIEEARKLGVAVTLDELYQHVVPLGLEPIVPKRPPPQWEEGVEDDDDDGDKDEENDGNKNSNNDEED